MEYQVLTPDHQQQMWRGVIGQLEERHFALTMDRALALAVMGDNGLPHPDAQARAKELDAQIAAVEQQHAKAVRRRGAEPAVAPAA